MPRGPAGTRPLAAGYTLLELLVVMVIGAILVALSIPSISGVMRGYTLETTGDIITNQIVLARQTALSGNHAVEVWFYQLPDYNQPTTATPTVYRAMQTFSEGDPIATGSPQLTAITKPVFFSAPVTISTAASGSSGAGTVSPLLPASPLTPSGSSPTLSPYQQNYRYSVFRFRPDGSTDLTAPNNSLTLILENDPVTSSNGLPKNYRALEIDPMIGTVHSYRP